MRLIDADELREHLFVGFDYDRAINDGVPKTEKEILAYWCGWNDALKSVVRFAPTVDPVERGHWVKSFDHYDKYMCSACGHLTNTESDNYCSCCGAKMDEVKEDENDKRR